MAGPLPLPGQDWPWTAIGRVLSDGSGPCSGVLVAPRIVLTVGHCVADSGWRAREPERLSFALETGTHGVAAVHLAPHSPSAEDGTIEGLQHDWALLELAQPAEVKPVPYGGPSAARRAFFLNEPLVKAGWTPHADQYLRTRDYSCKIQVLAPEATALAYRCPGGAGAGRSGSVLILGTDQGFEVVGIQSAVTTRASLEFGIAVSPAVAVSVAPPSTP